MSREDDSGASGYATLADVYERSRPSYPRQLLDVLVRQAGVGVGDPIADLGAGTGRLTVLLAERGLVVSAVEPVAEMRAQAPSQSGVTWTSGTFEHTGLADQSQRWVVSAQAFHRAETARALPEIHRILQPGGWLTVLWNAHHIRDEPILQRTYAILRRHVPTYDYVDRTTRMRRCASRTVGALPESVQYGLGRIAGSTGNPDRFGRGLRLISTGDFGGLVYHELVHRVPTSRARYLDLWRSRSHLQSIAGQGRFERFAAELSEYLDREKIDEVAVPYVCGAWSAQVRAQIGRRSSATPAGRRP